MRSNLLAVVASCAALVAASAFARADTARPFGFDGVVRPLGVVIGNPTIGEALSEDVVRTVLARNAPAVRVCGQRALLRTPTLVWEGGVELRVGSMGKVESARIDGASPEHPFLERCLLATVRRWEFPIPKHGGVRVAFPVAVSLKADPTIKGVMPEGGTGTAAAAVTAAATAAATAAVTAAAAGTAAGTGTGAAAGGCGCAAAGSRSDGGRWVLLVLAVFGAGVCGRARRRRP